MKMSKKQLGFTLVELLLVLGVIMGLSILELRKIRAESDYERAKAAGRQFAQVYTAFDKYLNLRRGGLQRMDDAAAADPNCNFVGGNVCEVDLTAAFNDNKIMPPNWTDDFPILKTRLRAYVFRDSQGATVTNPDEYNLEGIIFAQDPWDTGWGSGGARRDLINAAAKAAGSFAGRSVATNAAEPRSAVGIYGGWSVPGGRYPAGLAADQLVGIAQVQSSILNQFVRLDGSLPMTGSLDMGDYRINNASDMELIGNDGGTAGGPLREQLVSSLMPRWVLKGAYSVVDYDADPDNGTVPKPFCADSDLASKGLPRILLRWSALYNDMGGGYASGAPALTPEEAQATLVQPDTGFDFRAFDADNNNWHVKIKKYYDNGFIAGQGLAEVYCYYP